MSRPRRGRRRVQRPLTCARLEASPRGVACRLDDAPGYCYTCIQLDIEVDQSDFVWRDFDLGAAPHRTWLTYPSPPTADTWFTLLEDTRPVSLILAHADLVLPEGLWVHSCYKNDYILDRGLLLQVHTYEIHRSFCVASTYGHGRKHAYIISRHIRQAAMRQYCTLFFCGYKLWTSHTKDVQQGLQDMQEPPMFMHSWTGGDSDAVVPVTRDYHAYRNRNIWGSLRAGRHIWAPLPRWIRTMHRNHYWWWS
ncbi:uncharacterized protein LOC132839873 [Tachysurus vachellii]|uniref:uncharacterized protein LOC132839873 n=1 Tax=Tachysurus vachellii TaxID=175792 RepID=UPI00296B27A2|nr:uncharacterized protein LOC132839873 [Tachysurus vachellii]